MSPVGEAGFKRQGLLGGLLGSEDDNPSPSSTSNSSNAAAEATPAPTTTNGGGGGGPLGGLGSVVSGLTSGLGGLGQSTSSSTVSPTSASASTSLSSTSSTISSRSSSSTSSIPTTSSSSSSSSSSTLHTSTSSSSVSTSSASSTSVSVSTPEPVSQSEATTTFVSTSDNQVYTYTITLTSSAVPSESSETGTTRNGASSKSFLENKALSGTVFALVGIVVLVIIIMLSTWFLRRSRRNRLEWEAEMFPDNTWPSTEALGGNEKVDLARTPSDRTALSNGSGGYGHRQQQSDGPLRQSPPPQMPQVPLPGQGMGMNGFNPLPAPPGFSGPGGAWGPPLMQLQAYGYESPFATYQHNAYGPPPPSQVQVQQQGFGSGQPQPQPQVPAISPQQQVQDQRSVSSGSNPSPISNQGPPSVFGHNKSNSGGSSSGPVLTMGARVGLAQEAAGRASTGSDAYADYAFATGPGHQASQPRNLTIANA